jgi:nucleoside-diphosphate-sugar epimerase
MRILLIGGTGTISSAITRQLAAGTDELWLLNRGNHKSETPNNVKQVIADISNESDVLSQLGDMQFDAVCEFIGFLPSQVERDIRLFKGRTRQYVYISSASAYNKPAASHIITEGTTLANPYWEYSRNKIACEELLLREYRENGFPITIVRPSHTYLLGDKSVSVVFDCTKLKRAVPGFQATTRFDEGVRRCISYLLAHPELQMEDTEFDVWCDRIIAAQEKAKELV